MKGTHIAVTLGDPLGIGPEIVRKALWLQPARPQSVRWFLFGHEQVCSEAPRRWKALLKRDDITFVTCGTWPRGTMTPKSAGALSVAALQEACDQIQSWQDQKLVAALVTAPISKTHVKASGFDFPGHTEFLCDRFSVNEYAMLLFHDRLRVALATIHEPLRRVPDLLTPRLIQNKLELFRDSLQRQFGILRPRIAVCGLNPHAGENGHLGQEDQHVLRPVIQKLQRRWMAQDAELFGPEPADTVFYRALRGEFDGVLAMYHDQGLVAVKTTGFETGVNMTLGLPFVRTSPDHGIALDIAGQNKADPQSMIAALNAALKLSKPKGRGRR